MTDKTTNAKIKKKDARTTTNEMTPHNRRENGQTKHEPGKKDNGNKNLRRAVEEQHRETCAARLRCWCVSLQRVCGRLSLYVNAPVVWDHVGSKDNLAESVGSNTIFATQHSRSCRCELGSKRACSGICTWGSRQETHHHRTRGTPLLRASMDRLKRVADCHTRPPPTITRVPPHHHERASNHNHHSRMVPADALIASQKFSTHNVIVTDFSLVCSTPTSSKPARANPTDGNPETNLQFPFKIRHPPFLWSRQIFCSKKRAARSPKPRTNFRQSPFFLRHKHQARSAHSRQLLVSPNWPYSATLTRSLCAALWPRPTISSFIAWNSTLSIWT